MKKILSTFVMCLILGVGNVWAEQVQVSLYDGTNRDHELITQTVGGTNYQALNALDLTLVQLNQSDKAGTAWIQFSSPNYTIISSYSFGAIKNNNSPTYSVNDGTPVTPTSTNQQNPDIVSGTNADNTLKVATTTHQTKFMSWVTGTYYCRLKNFQLKVVIPEVVPTTTTMTTLTKLTNSDLDGNRITRTGYVPFVVKDPIDQTNPQNYFSATISAGATGESWTVLESGWSCEANAGSFIVRVPVQYTATNKQKGTFSATVHLESKNTYNTANDDQNAQITVGDVKQEYAISWGNSWVDGSEVDLFKGDIYPRTGNGGYLANTAGLTLGTPVVTEVLENPTGASTLVSFAANGAMTLHETGKVRLTYTQPGSTTHNEKRLTLTVNIIKRTPAFTLKSDEYVDGVHIFYVNHEYIPFVESSNEDFVTYPIEVTNNNSDNDQFISFVAENAITHAVPKEDIQITVHQEAGDLWNESSATYTIAIRENPIHVGTLCRRTITELFNDANFTIEKRYSARLDATGTKITIGTTAGGSNGGYVIFHFTGTPDALEWTEGVNYETTNGNNVTWTVEQSATNEEGSYTPLGAGNTFNEDAQYLKITISGTQSQGNITSLCITEKVGASITPDPIELVVLDDGNGGKLVMDASFTANVSNLTKLTLQLSSDEFILVRDGKTYNETANTLLLDYTDGLGIDKNASAVVQVHYVGNPTTDLDIDETCIVTALDENDVVQSTATIKVIELPAGDIPAVIIPGIADRTGIFTGTEMFIDGHATYSKYPYRKKEEVNLSAAFKGGVAAFDQLFIFGLTTNDNDLTVTVNGVTAPQINKPSATANSNAVTPCFIYTKSGNNYALSSIIPNVNIATKPTEFNITDMSKSYYFTGYAPYASCGSTWEENAVFLFTSKGNAVNLYFDNLELYARPKAATGNKVPVKQYTVNGIGEAIGLFGDPDMNVTTEPELALEVFVQGSGAAFAFASTSSTEFKPTIHLRGTNILESTAGASVRVTSSLLSMDATASQQSSPIQVLLKKDGGKNSKANLTITDTWADGTTRTNGILDLANLDVRPAPTIDLGNANTTLNINGGQYFLSNAANTSTSYTVSYAISYRKKSMAGDKAQMFGLGDDQPEGKVRFKDGSINCSVLPKAYFNESLYHNQTSMKCPQDTKIDGGTFNCDVLSCASTTSKGGSPTNSAGKALCKVSVPIQDTNSNGTAVLASDWMTYAASHGANTSDLVYYGIKSLQPTTIINDDEEEVSGVNLMLPSDKICFMEMVRIPWVLCTPDVTVQQTGVTQTLGGDKTVESSIAAGDEGITNVKLTARLLYAELDDYTKAAIANYTAPGGYTVSVAEVPRRHVQNMDSYLISDKIYWVRPVLANQWQMIVPPFDVANIYIVESYPEEQLLKDFGRLTTNKIGQEVYVIDNEDKIRAARLAQAQSMMDLVYYWMYDADPAGLKNDNDLWPKKGWDMSKFVREWVDYEVSKHNGNKAYQPIIEQLYHFTGSNWDANYYLYVSSGEWVDEGDKFVTDWQLVPTQSVKRGTGTPQTIMHKGGIYAMSFPYSIYNTGHDPDMTWDYWTGKYIIMEGYPTETNDIVGDVQVLSGTNTDWNGKPLISTVLADFTTAGRASLRGNSTFGELTVQKDNALILPAGGNTFIRWDKHTLAPGEGFMLANAPATPSPMPRRIASIDMMTGDVTYEPISGDDTNETPTSTPTISGDRDMLVYTVAGGLGVVPVVPQHVSIYNAAGQLVVSQYLTDNTQFALPTGIYLVCGEKDQAKAMVK